MIFWILQGKSPRKLKHNRNSFKASRFYGTTKASVTVFILKLLLNNAIPNQLFLSPILTQMNMNHKKKKKKEIYDFVSKQRLLSQLLQKANTSYQKTLFAKMYLKLESKINKCSLFSFSLVTSGEAVQKCSVKKLFLKIL